MYVELLGRSCFSFLRGASHPEEMIRQAEHLGLDGFALCDVDGIYGTVRAWKALRPSSASEKRPLEFIVGAELTLAHAWSVDGLPLVPEEDSALSVAVLARTKLGYENLCRLLTKSHDGQEKGVSVTDPAWLSDHAEGLFALVIAPRDPSALSLQIDGHALFSNLKTHFSENLALCHYRHLDGRDTVRERWAIGIAKQFDLPIVASARPLFHVASRKPLADVVSCIRRRTTLDQAGMTLSGNGEAYLRDEKEMRRIFRDHPEWVDESVRIGKSCEFSFDQLSYHFPCALDDGQTADERLSELTWEGVGRRFPGGISPDLRAQIVKELRLIKRIGVAPYFLSTYDVVEIARKRKILCQGRGSAANSAVCFMLGITAVDPSRSNLLFERFLSEERAEPPDIDIDFEHERREEVIQEIYERYGRDRAAMVSEVISYRGKSALREVSRVFGFSPEQADALSGTVTWQDAPDAQEKRLIEAGFDLQDARVKQVVALSDQLRGFPRHLSIHVGGFVLSSRPILRGGAGRTSPHGRSNRDPLGQRRHRCARLFQGGRPRPGDAHGDPQSLGHDPRRWGLTPSRGIALEHGFAGPFGGNCRHLRSARGDHTYPEGRSCDVSHDLSRRHGGGVSNRKPRTNGHVAAIAPRLFLRSGDRGRHRSPWPHSRRNGASIPATTKQRRRGDLPAPRPPAHPEPHPGSPTLSRAGHADRHHRCWIFGGEADQLRRDMAAWKKHGRLLEHRDRLLQGFEKKGISREFGEALFEQIKGFGEYGFPESHASSFALLVYASSWQKCHYPAHFTCAVLNAQPMGFYQPTSLVRDAQDHGVEVRDVSIETSFWDSTLEKPDPKKNEIESDVPGAHRALRLGFRLIRGFGEDAARRIERARNEEPFSSLDDLAHRARLSKSELEILAEAGALEPLEKERRNALWKSQAPRTPGLFEGKTTPEEQVTLPRLHAAEQLVLDYERKGLSVNDHPLRHHRKRLDKLGAIRAEDLFYLPRGTKVSLAGLVMARQRPATASGVVFITLEDETGSANLIVYSSVFERYHHVAKNSQILFVSGELERDEKLPVAQRRGENGETQASGRKKRASSDTAPTAVIHVIVKHIERWANNAGPDVRTKSRDFH